jgi:Ca-activated chloride channel family protein
MAVLSLTACGNSAEKLNNQGNEAYAQQAYEDALASYQSAQIENPKLAEPHYNAANALYRQGDYASTLEELHKALDLASSTDENQPPEIAQASLFNAGNSSYNTQELNAAIDAYRQALLLNPNDLDAKYNLELALQQQQEQEQQEQEQEENQEQEQSESGKEQNQDQEQDSEQKQDQSGNDENEEQNQDQSDNQSEQGQNQDEPQEGDEQESDQQNGKSQDEQQQESQQQSGQGESQPKEDDPTGQPNYAPAPGERMSEEQAKQLLAAIANDSDTLMERLNQILYVNMLPPTQDW